MVEILYDVVKRDKAYPCDKLLTAPDNKDSDMALTILAEQQDGLLTLTFNRPEKRNALNTETYLALTDALRQAARDEEVHVLLLQGQAECFTAGNDLADFVGKHALSRTTPSCNFCTPWPTSPNR